MNSSRRTNAILLFLLSVLVLHAQAPGLEWQRCLGGSGVDLGYGIQLSDDGGYAIVGFTTSTDGDVTGNHGARDFWLSKLDATGMLQWQHCYGGSDGDSPLGMIGATDGGYVLYGGTGSVDGDVTCTDTANGSAWVLKVDENGSLQWQTCLDGDLNEGATSVVSTADGGYLVAGGTYSNNGIGSGNHGQSDFLAAKLNAGGDLEWSRCYGGTGSEGAYAVKRTLDGGYVLAGIALFEHNGDVNTGGSGIIWVIKINAAGDLIWNRRMGGTGGPGMSDEVKDVLQNPDGSYLVVGSTGANDGDISGNHGGYDGWLVKLDANGAIVQQRCLGGSEDDYAYKAMPAEEGRYVVVGYTRSNDGDVSGNHGNADVWVLMLDADLNILWQTCIGGSNADLAYAMARTPANETIIAGRTQSDDGDVSGHHGYDDIWVAKLRPDPLLGLEEAESDAYFSTYPSPTSDLVNVRLPGALQANSTLDVLDITGRVVLHQNLGLGINVMQIQVASWAAGVYCLRLDSGDKLLTTRFVKR